MTEHPSFPPALPAAVGQTLAELPTPALLVDLDRLERNLATWHQACTAHGAQLRPHVKTHKSPDLARLQLAAGAAGLTVAKLAEAEVFAAHGLRDIFVAYPVVGAEKWARAAALAGRITLTVGVDSAEGALGLSAAAVAAGVRIPVRVEIDAGLHRSGVPAALAPTLARQVAGLPGLTFDGIFGFRSVFYPDAAGQSLGALGRQEGEFFVEVAQAIRRAGVPVAHVSVGSTPTARAASAVPGVTEVRPGTYVFGDDMMAAHGGVTEDDLALSVLCTVVSAHHPGQVTIDGGSKTFAGDSVPERLGRPGYARAAVGHAHVVALSEEHGIVRTDPARASPRVGDRLAFYPLHVCTVVNLADELIGVRAGRVECRWPIRARGKRT